MRDSTDKIIKTLVEELGLLIEVNLDGKPTEPKCIVQNVVKTCMNEWIDLKENLENIMKRTSRALFNWASNSIGDSTDERHGNNYLGKDLAHHSVYVMDIDDGLQSVELARYSAKIFYENKIPGKSQTTITNALKIAGQIKDTNSSVKDKVQLLTLATEISTKAKRHADAIHFDKKRKPVTKAF